MPDIATYEAYVFPEGMQDDVRAAQRHCPGRGGRRGAPGPADGGGAGVGHASGHHRHGDRGAAGPRGAGGRGAGECGGRGRLCGGLWPDLDPWRPRGRGPWRAAGARDPVPDRERAGAGPDRGDHRRGRHGGGLAAAAHHGTARGCAGGAAGLLVLDRGDDAALCDADRVQDRARGDRAGVAGLRLCRAVGGAERAPDLGAGALGRPGRDRRGHRHLRGRGAGVSGRAGMVAARAVGPAPAPAAAPVLDRGARGGQRGGAHGPDVHRGNRRHGGGHRHDRAVRHDRPGRGAGGQFGGHLPLHGAAGHRGGGHRPRGPGPWRGRGRTGAHHRRRGAGAVDGVAWGRRGGAGRVRRPGRGGNHDRPCHGGAGRADVPGAGVLPDAGRAADDRARRAAGSGRHGLSGGGVDPGLLGRGAAPGLGAGVPGSPGRVPRGPTAPPPCPSRPNRPRAALSSLPKYLGGRRRRRPGGSAPSLRPAGPPTVRPRPPTGPPHAAPAAPRTGGSHRRRTPDAASPPARAHRADPTRSRPVRRRTRSA